MPHSQTHFRFIIVILVAMTLIPLGDTAGKLMMQQGASPLFVAWSRVLIGVFCFLPFSGFKLTEFTQLFHWRLLLRALFFIGAVTSILKGIETESLANVFGAFFIGPILSYFLAAIILKEKISKLRSLLLFVGFAGALMVIKPGIGMTAGLAYGVLAGCFYGCLLVANRWLAGSFRPRFILLSTLVIGSLILTPFSYDLIPTLNTNMSLLVLMSAICSALGNLLIIEANRRLPASVVAPFVYTQLIAATALSLIVFNQLPDGYSLIGLFILLLSGLASFFVSREK